LPSPVSDSAVEHLRRDSTMSFLLGYWLRGIMGRLWGKRRGSSSTAVRQKAKRRRCALQPSVEPLETRPTPVTGLTSFSPGAFVIDMGQATQTVAYSLKPYGMVDDLVQNQHIPVDWAINSNKTVFEADFTAGGKSDSGGSFIIEAPFAAASTITRLRAQGVVV